MIPLILGNPQTVHERRSTANSTTKASLSGPWSIRLRVLGFGFWGVGFRGLGFSCSGLSGVGFRGLGCSC